MKTINTEIIKPFIQNSNEAMKKCRYSFCKRMIITLIGILFVTVSSYAQDNSYVINKGDVIEILVMEHPEFSLSNITVLPDGTIQYPGLGGIKVDGMTVQKLTSTMKNNLERYVVNPVVTVFVRKIKNQMLNVLGYVNNPGQFQIYESTELLSAISMAGGIKNIDKSKEIIIVRVNQDTEKVNIKEYMESIGSSKNPIMLQVGDTVYVKEPGEFNWSKLTFFSTLIWAAASILNIVLK